GSLSASEDAIRTTVGSTFSTTFSSAISSEVGTSAVYPTELIRRPTIRNTATQVNLCIAARIYSGKRTRTTGDFGHLDNFWESGEFAVEDRIIEVAGVSVVVVDGDQTGPRTKLHPT